MILQTLNISYFALEHKDYQLYAAKNNLTSWHVNIYCKGICVYEYNDTLESIINDLVNYEHIYLPLAGHLIKLNIMIFSKI